MTAAVYPPDSIRHAVAALLAVHIAATSLFIKGRLSSHCPTDVEQTLTGMKRAGLVEHNETGRRWRFTEQGLAYWMSQQVSAAALAAAQSFAVKPGDQPCPIYHPPELLKRGLVRLSGNTQRLAMAHRPGAFDFKACARIDGPWRIFPDGTREPVNG